jgi:hypothetical protein
MSKMEFECHRLFFAGGNAGLGRAGAHGLARDETPIGLDT